MKKIHVLPTENESRLRYNSFNKVYELCEFPRYHTDIKSTHHIYITSDEEIKEGDWYLDTFNTQRIKANEFSDHKHYGDACRKIILTTDEALIKDTVQAIDDEFLEWFVKNQSCEDVGVEISCGVCKSNNSECLRSRDCAESAINNTYKTIIPKEKPFKHEFKVLSKEEVLANRSNAYEFIDFDKQETLEEDNIVFITKEQAVGIFGAKKLKKMIKKQDKNKYSEEDMREAIMFGANGMYGLQIGEEGYTDNQIKRFLETFKNK